MHGRRLYQWGQRLLGGLVCGTVLPVAAQACTVCWAGDDALAQGMNISILFLMSMPFVIFGSIGSTIYLAQKRAQKHLHKGLAWSQKEKGQ